jgi:helicase required for RNAi-mediated heterochromatin assembly 1
MEIWQNVRFLLNPLVSKLTRGVGLTEDQMVPVPEAPPINLGLPMEESDIEYEQITELQEEFDPQADGAKDTDILSGEWLPFKRKFTGRHPFPSFLNDKKIKKMLNAQKNLFDIPVAMRGEVYRFFEKQMNMIALREFRVRLKEYENSVKSYVVTKVRCPAHRRINGTDISRDCATFD